MDWIPKKSGTCTSGKLSRHEVLRDLARRVVPQKLRVAHVRHFFDMLVYKLQFLAMQFRLLTPEPLREMQNWHGYRATHPPVRLVQGEGQVVHKAVCMVIAVGQQLHPDRKAFQAEVKVWAHGALYPHHVADILLAVVAMVQMPAASACSSVLWPPCWMLRTVLGRLRLHL